MNEIKIAVVGAGYWGPNIIRNLYTLKNINQIFVCDIDKKRLNEIETKFPTIKTTTNFDEIINNPSISAVAIATPLNTHYELAAKALKNNKHVFVEKPMTPSSVEGSKLVELAKKNNKILMVGHTFVYSETIIKIKSIITRGTIGKVFYYDSTRINLGLMKKNSNVVWDLAPHDLSIINFLIPQKIVSVQSFCSSFVGKEFEVAHIFLKHTDNISSHINISWLSPVKVRRTIIGGSKKMIVLNDINPSEKIKIYNRGIVENPTSPFFPIYRMGDITIPKVRENEALENELNHFIECIRKNKTPLTPGEDGVKIVKILEAIEKSAKLNKEIKL